MTTVVENPLIIGVTKAFITKCLELALGSKSSNVFKDTDINSFLEDYIGSALDSRVFEKYINEINLQRVIINYLIYGNLIINSHTSQSEKNYYFNTPIGRKSFLERISYEAVEYVNHNRSSEWRNIEFELVYKYFEEILGKLEIAMRASLINKGDYNFLLIEKKIDTLELNISNYLKAEIGSSFKEYSISEDVEAEIERYTKQIKRNHEKVFVHGLGDIKLSSIYIEPKFNTYVSKKEKSIMWESTFEYSNVVTILGGAGFGKTLFLKSIINNFEDLIIPCIERYIPIYINMKRLEEYIDIKGNIFDYITYMINQTTAGDLSVDSTKKLLGQGRLVILFDGIDEISLKNRSEIHSKIKNFSERFSTCGNYICITSRDNGISNFEKQHSDTVLIVEPIDKKDVESYLSKMVTLKKFEKENKQKLVDICESLIEKNVLTSKLVLSLIVAIYSAEKNMPVNIVKLFEKLYSYIAKDREFGITDGEVSKCNYSFEKIQTIIENIATFEELAGKSAPNNKTLKKQDILDVLLELHADDYECKNEARNAIDEFLKFCADRSELYIKETEDEYRFYHDMFFKYFYASWLIKNCQNDYENIIEAVENCTHNDEFPIFIHSMLKNDYKRKYKDYVFVIFEEVSEGKVIIRDRLINISMMNEPKNVDEIMMIFENNSQVFNDFINCFKYEDKYVYAGYSIINNLYQRHKTSLTSLLAKTIEVNINVQIVADMLRIDLKSEQVRFETEKSN